MPKSSMVLVMAIPMIYSSMHTGCLGEIIAANGRPGLDWYVYDTGY
jgi:hypothetical protein